MFDGQVDDEQHGITVPRLWTPSLRPLDKKTSKGFDVIEFARIVLDIKLYPWQQWLLVHALELNADGSYRFNKVLVEVARQNGKTTLVTVLAAYWLFVDALAHPDHVSPDKFLVVGAAQTLDNAKGPYTTVKRWCDPSEPVSDLTKPDLRAMVRKVSNVNGEEGITTKALSQYIVRAANNIRSKSQLWGISNAGDYRSVVLKTLDEAGKKSVAQWNENVETSNETPAEFAKDHDVSLGYFSWSAPDGCALSDATAIRQANPSIGYGVITVDSIRADIPTMTESAYRTEDLCQWVTADVKPYIDPGLWRAGIDKDSSIPQENRVVLAVDTSVDRKTTYVAAAGYRADGLPHVELIARRDGMMWVPEYLDRLRQKWPNITEVAVQSKGCPAVDFVDPLTEKGWTVRPIEGFRLGACCGRFRDRIREGKLRHLPQPAVEQQEAVAVARQLGEVMVWDRNRSAMQISGLIAESEALYALETMQAAEALPTHSAYEDHGLMVV